MLSGPYREFYDLIAQSVPGDRLFHDELRTLAYGTDASFYRLIPKLVVRVESEREVCDVLSAARRFRLPLTFRAAGTSLSGQAVTDSILVQLGRSWAGHRIQDGGAIISLQPGVVGGHANVILAPYGKKIGPDPASINSAMIGGIAANNASGMCCGTAQNSYRTLHSMRVIFADGTLLDTADAESRRAFLERRADLVQTVSSLSAGAKANRELAERISWKFSMKNTMGYSLNALIDFDDPIDIIQHLMIGSEGTLGFMSEISYRTVPEHPFKATALIIFPDIATACSAVPVLKKSPVDAVELMDRASLHSIEEKAGTPAYLKSLPERAASLLVETRAKTREALLLNIEAVTRDLATIPTLRPIQFTTDPQAFVTLWNIRKGLFPSVGAMRQTGTTVIIEDVAFPLPRLAEATLDLQTLFQKHGYHDAIIFGHALEGNLHFVFKQDFNIPEETERYRRFMDDVVQLVIHRYDGALKAEHGTGRNMAPFVETEWGAAAYSIMRSVKAAFDPDGLLNPGVILNPDPLAHMKDLKPMPAADPIVDKCIECGFCEVQCPSRHLTLTPRHRIVVYREMARLRTAGSDVRRLESLASLYDYQGDETCATDGLCALSCPVGIDTGQLVKQIRLRHHSPALDRIASGIANHLGLISAILRGTLTGVDCVHRVAGSRFTTFSAEALRKLSGGRVPLWNRFMPRGASRLPSTRAPQTERTVVYFPTCINRTFGPARGEEDGPQLSVLVTQLLERAGYSVRYPDALSDLCCGMAFASKGFKEQGDRKAHELEMALVRASERGKYPVLVDMSPCLYRMKEIFSNQMEILEPVQFAEHYLIDRLDFHKLPLTVAIHTTCSAEKMGLAGGLRALAERCADRVVVPRGIGCCAWAGDRGFTVPELNASALHDLRSLLPPGCTEGFSTSRTCEIGLSLHSGIHYRSILYLVERSTRPEGV